MTIPSKPVFFCPYWTVEADGKLPVSDAGEIQVLMLRSRRDFTKLSALAPILGFSQGVATRNVRPQPRRKSSGKPFAASFVDVAAEAGLTNPAIYGTDTQKSYIIEAVGGGVAFLDYDNDGWLDVFVLSGTRLDADVRATNRLYKNNRDGTLPMSRRKLVCFDQV